jgi:hypothetical protein
MIPKSGNRLSEKIMLKLNRTLVAIACGFLFKSRSRRALRQNSFDIFQRHFPGLQQHKEMKQEIRTFSDQMMPIILDRRDDRLNNFLAELPGAMYGALVEQLSRVGRIAPGCSPGVNDGSKVMDRETRHNPSTRPVALLSTRQLMNSLV